jgi:predicted ATPase/DNA-binding SARP family transcriptional activator
VNAKLFNLPSTLTSFIGRQRELADVERLLATTHLLTLTGAGGCGKTRLALQFATQRANTFHDGVGFVELTSLNDAALVPQSVAKALGVQETPRQPLTETLSNYLERKHLLLILDNCEHLRTAIGQLVETLLLAAPNLKILATSRESFSLAGETTYLVPSLSMPEPQYPLGPGMDAVSNLRYDAPTLFIERARAVLPDFSVTPENVAAIVHVCQRLDGMPLAIELAAARVRVLTVEQIAFRLDDRFNLLTSDNPTAIIPRHQTLRATIEWSYQLLSEKERVLFRRLAVFQGGFTLKAAEAICADEALERGQVLMVLSSLISKSLVTAETQHNSEARYLLLETVRQYAREKLSESDEKQRMQVRHLEFFLHVAEEAAPFLTNSQKWLDRLEAVNDDLRSALEYCKLEENYIESGYRMVTALWRFWHTCCHLAEGRAHATTLLGRSLNTPAPQTLMRAKALNAAGALAYLQSDYAAARLLLEEARAVFQRLGDRAGIAEVRHFLGNMALSQGNYLIARTEYEASLEVARELGDQRGIARLLSNLGLIAQFLGDLAVARSFEEASLALFRELQDQSGIAHTLNILGDIARYQGDWQMSRTLEEESLAMSRVAGNRWVLASALDSLGDIALSKKRYATATRFYRQSLQLFREDGGQSGTIYCLESFAAIEAAHGRGRRSAHLMGAGERFREAISLPLPPVYQPEYNSWVAEIRSQLDEAEFTEAWAHGREMSMEQAIEYALAQPALHVQIAPEIRILALGPVQVYRGETLLTSTDWTLAKAKELFFYLLTFDARTREQIGLDLWPDAPPAQLRSHLKIALHHLRRALGGAQWILFEDDRYTFNRSLNYWYDVEMFESNLALVHPLETKVSERAIRHLEQATQLYRGDWLEDAPFGDWHLDRREELQRKYLDELLAIGKWYFDHGRFEEAIEKYRLIIRRDPYQEVAHRALMRGYARQGELSQALRHYRMLVDLLRDELGGTPAPETAALFERLRHGEPV